MGLGGKRLKWETVDHGVRRELMPRGSSRLLILAHEKRYCFTLPEYEVASTRCRHASDHRRCVRHRPSDRVHLYAQSKRYRQKYCNIAHARR